jgi:hypothetical protein
MAGTHAQRLADLLLGRSVVGWIREQRPDRSYRAIARDLAELTGGQVDVAPETLRLWAPDDAERASA